MAKNEQQAVELCTRRWVREFVIELNLCPFARREWERDTIRYRLYAGRSSEDLLAVIDDECSLLDVNAHTETTMIIVPNMLQDFLDFNDFLGSCEELINSTSREGVYQVASFHPRYQFAGTEPDDAENYTNRSPYPMLHLLREASVEIAIANHPDIGAIPDNNVARLNALGAPELAAQLDEFLAAKS
jgi:hypothetical protein